jgi:hypothetical protein
MLMINRYLTVQALSIIYLKIANRLVKVRIYQEKQKNWVCNNRSKTSESRPDLSAAAQKKVANGQPLFKKKKSPASHTSFNVTSIGQFTSASGISTCR